MAAAALPRWVIPTCLAAVYLVWGSTYYAIRVAVQTLPPWGFASVRLTLAGAVLLAAGRWRGEAWPTLPQWRSGFVLALLLFVIGNGGVMLAAHDVSSGVIAVIIATTTLWSAVLGRLYGERLTGRQWAGVLLGLLGVAVLKAEGEVTASPTAVGILLLSALGWALGTLESRRRALPAPITSNGMQMACGGLLMGVLALLHGEHLPAAPSTASLLAGGYLIVMGSLVGFSAFTILVRNAPLPVAMSYVYVNPVVAVLLAVIMGDGVVGIPTAIGLVVILAAVALVTWSPSNTPARD